MRSSPATKSGLLFLALLLNVSFARAEPPTGPDSKPAAAPSDPAHSEATANRGAGRDPHLLRAHELFQAQKYVEAAEELQLAYQDDPKPLFLFNAGQAYRKGEQREKALKMYEEFLKTAPEGPLTVEAHGYVTDLQALMKAEANLQDVNLRLESEHSQLESERKKAEEIEQTLKKERKRPWYKHPAFIATASAVGITAVLGGVVLLGLGAAGKTDGGTITVTMRGN